MNCKYCGTPLPADAMFCGECGRSVVVTSVRIAAPARVATDAVDGLAPLATAKPTITPTITVPPEILRPVAANTVVSDPVASDPDGDAHDDAEPDANADAAPTAAPAGVSAGDTAVLEPLLLRQLELDLASNEAAPPPQHPDPALEELHDIEATRIVRGGPAGARFVLQFSTGESHAVFGSGLIGRNPVAEPGEYFDTRIAISDPGKSVSKTHLEFGQSDGQFWILDRFSANGTIVRQPGATATRCDGGKRYIVPRGARIDLGEQFLVVS